MRRGVLQSLILFLSAGILAAGCGDDTTSTVTVEWNGTRSVVAQTDIKYGEGETRSGTNVDLMMDVYSPEAPASGRQPVMLIVHGGAWAIGDKSLKTIVDLAHFYASRGFIACTINYRMIGDDPIAAPDWWTNFTSLFLDEASVRASYAGMVDTATAVRFIRANADLLGADPNHIFAVGSSAGAFNVVHVALDTPDAYLSTLPVNNPQESSELQLVIDLWGGCFRRQEIDANDPPVLILHGTADPTVPFALGQRLDESLTTAGVAHQFIPLEGYGHAAWSATVDGKTLPELQMEFIATNGGIRVTGQP